MVHFEEITYGVPLPGPGTIQSLAPPFENDPEATASDVPRMSPPAATSQGHPSRGLQSRTAHCPVHVTRPIVQVRDEPVEYENPHHPARSEPSGLLTLCPTRFTPADPQEWNTYKGLRKLHINNIAVTHRYWHQFKLRPHECCTLKEIFSVKL